MARGTERTPEHCASCGASAGALWCWATQCPLRAQGGTRNKPEGARYVSVHGHLAVEPGRVPGVCIHLPEYVAGAATGLELSVCQSWVLLVRMLVALGARELDQLSDEDRRAFARLIDLAPAPKDGAERQGNGAAER